jgi:hypothetical protein
VHNTCRTLNQLSQHALNRENAIFKIDIPREPLTWVAQFQRQGFSRFAALACHRI